MQGADVPINRPCVIRSVWSYNLDAEFEIIRSIVDQHPVISMDTEFPGIVFRPNTRNQYFRDRDPGEHYFALKENVNRSKLIQVGIAMSDEFGILPNLGTNNVYIWEFNFRDFDLSKDAHAVDSVELLKRQGIDFERNRVLGIDSVRFAELMMSSGLVLNEDVIWATFHGAYDFGYFVKCLTQRFLPENLTEFLDLVKIYFGGKVYDVKYLLRFCSNLFGGLERVGQSLGIGRMVGKSHQAGSDSLLTLHVFLRVRQVYFGKENEIEKYANLLYGLEPFD